MQMNYDAMLCMYDCADTINAFPRVLRFPIPDPPVRSVNLGSLDGHCHTNLGLAREGAAGETAGMKPPLDPHYRHRFPAEIISHAVWLYHVFTLSLRYVELLLAERRVVVSYETVRRWCEKFAQTFASRLRRHLSTANSYRAIRTEAFAI